MFMPTITATPQSLRHARSVVMTRQGFINAMPRVSWRPYMQPSNSPTWHNVRFRMPIDSNAQPDE
eukprot:7343742-Heterocapsa_arctica.AAC.1